MKVLLLPALLLLTLTCFAQQAQVIKRKGYTLSLINDDQTFNPAEQQRIIETFFTVYPKLAREYNKETRNIVKLKIDTVYKGVAETDDGHIRISARWMRQHPEDVDVVTHEVMHIVQDYQENTAPGWLTEGIADYARYQFGINNSAAKWALPDYKAGQSYINGYRITARFLVWIDIHQKKGIVKILDAALRNHNYTDATWQNQTGKTLDELWVAYTADPKL